MDDGRLQIETTHYLPPRLSAAAAPQFIFNLRKILSPLANRQLPAPFLIFLLRNQCAAEEEVRALLPRDGDRWLEPQPAIDLHL